jgi:hypothetical protein
LSVGIPISVTGTKSVTADGTYIINSIPNAFSFTYLCKENQPTTASIEDLYTSVITGEFFQGSQIRIASTGGMVTDAAATSTITVNTPSAHGFKVNTPFYFLNLNSTVSQVFDSSNSTTKSFDASNSATAQTFDGSNTLNSINIDFSNSAVVGGVTSAISSVNAAADTISVTHTTENFQGKPIGTPLYYNVTTSSNYFADNPRGVVYLKTNNTLGTLSSTFQVSAVPDGTAIDITASMTGTFQLANQARTFAGNNVDLTTEQTLAVVNDAPKEFNGANAGGKFGTCTSFPGTSTVNVSSGSGLADLTWYEGAMVFYTTTGTAAAGLSNNTTYFVTNFFQQGTSTTYSFSLKPLPTSPAIVTISGGTGTHTFTQIGVSVDRDVFHVFNNGYVVNDMLRYDYPAGGKFGVVSIDQDKDFYFVSSVFDAHNFTLNQVIGELVPATDSRTGTNAGSAITPTSVTAIGFGAGLTYARTSGTLPPGLTLNPSTGAISGTPSGAYATANVVITATDSAGTTGTQTITFQFNPAPNLYSFSSATFTTGGQDNSPSGPNINQIRSGLGSPGWANTYLTMPETTGFAHWVVPETGNYTFDVRGSQGTIGNNGGPGGLGGRVVGTVALTQGETLILAMGQRGVRADGNGNWQSGGGGGASVVARGSSRSSATPLFIAGGGGGGYMGDGYGGQYQNSVTTSGGGGSGGGGGGNGGGGGGGFTNNGSSSGGGVASSFRNGGTGGNPSAYPNGNTGGFGGCGGGTGGGNPGGGGGGFNGGNWGTGVSGDYNVSGQQGSHYNAGSSTSFTAAFQSGPGTITITRL